jgi:hypothetical protein
MRFLEVTYTDFPHRSNAPAGDMLFSLLSPDFL